MPTPELPEVAGAGAAPVQGELEAALDAIHQEDNRIGGRAFTFLTEPLSIDATDEMLVEATLGFGEWTDETGNARVLINGEVIGADGRNSTAPYNFHTLERGLQDTDARFHPVGSLVLDISENASALDHLRRGFLVNYAVGEDLRTIARNLGLQNCAGLDQETLRRVIKAVAYLAKQPIHAFVQALEALTDGEVGTDFVVYERTSTNPWVVYAQLVISLGTNILGRFILNGGEPALTTDTLEVETAFDIITPTAAAYPGSPSLVIEGREFTYPATPAATSAFGVYLDTPEARRGVREGMTNYAVGGSAVGNVLTLGSSPGPAGTPVIVDYTGVSAHYLAADETVRQETTPNDRWAYLSDPLLAARCLLEEVRAAGIRVDVSARPTEAIVIVAPSIIGVPVIVVL